MLMTMNAILPVISLSMTQTYHGWRVAAWCPMLFKEKGHSHGVVKVTENSHGVVLMPIKLSLNLKVLLKWLIILIFYYSVYS